MDSKEKHLKILNGYNANSYFFESSGACMNTKTKAAHLAAGGLCGVDSRYGGSIRPVSPYTDTVTSTASRRCAANRRPCC